MTALHIDGMNGEFGRSPFRVFSRFEAVLQLLGWTATYRACWGLGRRER